MKRSLLLVLVILTGCCRPTQRFVPTSTIELALDSKTGQECVTYPKGVLAKGGDLDTFPYCIDLYNAR